METNKVTSKIAYYLVGFTDGEGSFNISVVNRNKDFKSGWKIEPSFNISQKDDSIPKSFQKILNCGTIRYRKDGICYFEVRKINDLSEKILPFFRKHKLKSKKRIDFQIFSEIIKMIVKKKHLYSSGIKKILSLRNKMNYGGKHKYDDQKIISTFS